MAHQNPTTLDAIRTMRRDPDAIVEAGEVVDMRFPAGDRMSLRGGKLFHLLIQTAGVDVAEETTHRIALAALNESFHVAIPELIELVEELQTTTLKLTDAKGRKFTKSGPLLADAEREGEVQAELRYQFSATPRKAIANSNHWTVISKRAVLAFEIRYALRLYKVLSLRAGMRKTLEEFTVKELRELLGVSAGMLADWKSLRRRALEPALAEINQLARFHAGFVPLTRGRRVVGVRLAWGLKNHAARAEALRELDRPEVGRKERRGRSGRRAGTGRGFPPGRVGKRAVQVADCAGIAENCLVSTPIPAPMSPAQAVQRTGGSRRTVMRAIEACKLKARRDNRNRWKVAPDDLDKCATTQCAPSEHAQPDTLTLPTHIPSQDAVELAAARTENRQLIERLADVERDRNHWRKMADKLAAAGAGAGLGKETDMSWPSKIPPIYGRSSTPCSVPGHVLCRRIIRRHDKLALWRHENCPP